MRTFDRLITDAESLAEKTMTVDLNIAPAYAQAGMVYAMIAIA